MSGPVRSATTGVAGAPHVVLVHGTLDRSAGLLRLSRRLDGCFRVTRYDRRGYGRSAPHPGPFGIEAQVADLGAVIDAAPDAGEPLLLVGHSYGGNVALAFADRFPERAAAVVTYEPPMSWEPWWSAPGVPAGDWTADPAEAAERFMRRLIGDARWERLPPASRAARRAEGPAFVGELHDLQARPPWDPERVTVPVLALHGERGSERHRRGSLLIGGRIAGAEVAAVTGARHFGPNTHAAAVASLVIDFVSRRAGVSPPVASRSSAR